MKDLTEQNTLIQQLIRYTETDSAIIALIQDKAQTVDSVCKVIVSNNFDSVHLTKCRKLTSLHQFKTIAMEIPLHFFIIRVYK